MRQKKLIYILVAEAIALLAFHLLQLSFSGIFSSIAAFPFEQIGWGLRKLSLSGTVGNILAIILYMFISLLPVFLLILLRKKQKACRLDNVLAGMSVLLFVVIYYMINPGLFRINVPGTAKWAMGVTFYSVLSGYLIIRILKDYTDADTQKLQRGLKLLLFFLTVIFIYAICGQNMEALLASIQKVQGDNSAFTVRQLPVTAELIPTYFFLVLHYLVSILPYLFDIGVVFLSIRTLEFLEADRYSEESVNAVKRLADFCVRALGIIVTADVIFNLLQLIFCGYLYQTDYIIVIPVLSVVFVLAALLFSRYIQEDQKLKQYNDLFI